MRIAFVSTILGYPWGSPDRLWSDLAARSLARGDDVFLGISALTADSPAVRGLLARGARLFLRSRNSIFTGRRDHWLRRLPGFRTRRLEYQLHDFQPQLVLLTQGATYDALAEFYLVDWLQRTGTPYLVICHNSNDGPAPSAPERLALHRYFNGAAGILFVSSQNRSSAGQQLGLDLSRARLIQNPLAMDDTGALPWPDSPAVPQLGFVGRIDIGHKGLDLLLEALARIQARQPFQLTLTGRNEDPDALSALLARHGLGDRVRVQPPVSAPGLRACYQAMELFLLTSRYEGCPSSMIEALMCGRPVLATPVGGVSDWVEDGVNGFVASGLSVAAIQATLERALSHRAAWPGMGAAARRSFELRRDPDPVQTLQEIADQAAAPLVVET